MPKARTEVTREARRFHWLILQFERSGLTQTELSERLGVSQTYLSKWRNPERSGRTSIGAEIIRFVKQGLGISEAYFYDEYDGERQATDYRLGTTREAEELGDAGERPAELREMILDHQRRIAALEKRRRLRKSRTPA